MSEDYFIDTATMSLEYYQNMKKEMEKLHFIIKEVREYITKQVHRNQQFYEMDIENILEILDKADGDKEWKLIMF